MAFDIYLSKSEANSAEVIRVFHETHSFVHKDICDNNDLPLLSQLFSDFYGEFQVYFNQLESLLNEVEFVRRNLLGKATISDKQFFEDFRRMIEMAIHSSDTILLVGD